MTQSINSIITSLYKFSITIQNPAHRDRTARAAKINVSFWHEHDLRHVQDKFPRCSDAKLLRSLAQANTKRRQLFAYHKRHKEKIRYYRDSIIQEVPTEHSNISADTDANPFQGLHPPGASTIQTRKTKLTMTTISTVSPPMKTIAASTSGKSRRTNITIDPLSAADDVLNVPPPPNHAKDFFSPFICPFCFLTIDPINNKAWE